MSSARSSSPAATSARWPATVQCTTWRWGARGKGDGPSANPAGLGGVPPGRVIAPDRVRPGDVVLLSGDVGRHGMAIMAVREGLTFESEIDSDCAPLIEPVRA